MKQLFKHAVLPLVSTLVLGVAAFTVTPTVDAKGSHQHKHHQQRMKLHRHAHHHRHHVMALQPGLDMDGPPLPPEAILSAPLPDVVMPKVGRSGHGDRLR